LAPVRTFFRNPLLRAFLTAPSGIFGGIVVLAIIGVAIFGPGMFQERADAPDFLHVREGPSWDHPLGTDPLGRDIFAQLMVATRLSLGLALGAAGIALVLGVTIGSAAALVRPRFRPIPLRVIDTMLSFPALLTAIFVTVIIGRGGAGAMIGAGIAFSFSLARVSSTLALAVGGRDYISAARVLGVPTPRLFLRYVLPGIAEPLIVATSVIVTASIITVSALSFLGLGVQAPAFDWGGMLITGIRSIYVTPAAALGPAAAIAISAIAFGFTGEAIARAMNPRLWTQSTEKSRGPRDSGVVTERSTPDAPPVRVGSTGELGTRDQPDLALDVRDLVVTFPTTRGPVEVVKGVSMAVPVGEVVGIVGESGSGKTMTALAIAQLTPYPGRVTGRIEMFGENAFTLPRRRLNRLLGTKLAVIFQDPMSSLNPALRIGTQLTQGVRVHRKLSKKEATRLAISALTEVHIPGAERQLSRFPHEFSGGMRQRAMIAMGLMKEPALLLADEPTTALDVTVQAQVMELLSEVNRTHRTAVILISHNLALVNQNCHRVLVMYAGRIVEDMDAGQLGTNPLHPYTQALLRALPDIGRSRSDLLASIPGEVPDIASPPPGCAFHPRCPLALERCTHELPALLRRPDGRRVACHVVNADIDGAGPSSANGMLSAGIEPG
jgi:oligopeptide/dipeptide ABC transporter ATP-binding protein